ncbi:MAG: PPC domain-containing protein [Anaerolineales bacterium]
MRKHLVILPGVLFALLILPWVAAAQAPELDETYVYITGEYQVDYPSAWTIDLLGAGQPLIMASDEDLFSASSLSSGSAGLTVFAPIPANNTTFDFLAAEGGPEAIARRVAEDFTLADDPPARAEAVSYGGNDGFEVEVVDNPNASYLVITLDVGADNPLLMIGTTAPGEMDMWRELYAAIAETFAWGDDVTAFDEMLGPGDAQDGADIGAGALVEGSLDENNEASLGLYAQENTLLNIRMAGLGESTPTVRIDTPDGTSVANEQAAAPGALVSLFIAPPSTGVYTVTVAAPNAEASDFVISVEAQENTTGGGPIAYGETQAGFLLDGDQAEVWTFTGSTGDVVTIFTDSTIDTYLELSGPDGSLITEDDDGGAGLNAQISAFELPADGEYTIRVRGFSTAARGPYDLTLESQ